MAVYKVPQDVEADDKLLGPFSFRQFIYLIIVGGAIVVAWLLGSLFIPLAILPLPVILFFGALALPLRKDQPMEIYLAAVVSYYLKPRKRLWEPDGVTSLVEITAPKIVEIQRAKDLSQTEAERRFSYLADIVDSGGWAVRGTNVPAPNTAMTPDAYYAAQQTEDILDTGGNVSQSFDHMIEENGQHYREEVMQRMHQLSVTPPVAPVPQAAVQPAAPDPTYTSFTLPAADMPHLSLNPYPTSMHQHVLQPLSHQPVQQPHQLRPVPLPNTQVTQSPAQVTPKQTNQPVETPSVKPPSPDIINLANNPDLTIETIAREANRIHQKEDLPEDEVVISLR